MSKFVKRTDSFWAPFEKYNNLEAPKRLQALKELGIDVDDPEVLGILTKSHFVIPGKTRYRCQQCGECCRYARKVAQLTYDPCPFLTPENQCAKHDNRYLVCKWFPYWVYTDPKHGELLTIKPYCIGFGKGDTVDYQSVLAKIKALSVAEDKESDGAFVIHEVLFVPGRKDWAFPSKADVDALMAYIMNQNKLQKGAVQNEQPADRNGEVHYAHHFTSGLLGTLHDPMLTIKKDGVITDVNEAFCKLSGRERSSLIQKPLSTLFINHERINAAIKSCFAQGRETASPQRLKLADETAIPVLLNALVFRDRADGLVHSALLCFNSVSATVFNEVSQSKNYARGLLEASLDALFVIDKDGVITDVNEAAVVSSGRIREDLLGLSFKSLFADPDLAQKGVDKTFAEEKVRNYELTLLDVSKQAIPVSFNAAVYKDLDGVVQGVFAAARDMRERIMMVKALEEAKNSSRGAVFK
ncbi:MAG: PAS domain-containing protein [Fibrobacteres bacterium]|nr:PAS domain-containing protein [Fibrobacterota bacterium]